MSRCRCGRELRPGGEQAPLGISVAGVVREGGCFGPERLALNLRELVEQAEFFVGVQ